MNVLFSSSITISVHPETQHLPIPRATTAAWEVLPPRPVKIPWDAFIPTISSGEVSSLTKITFSFLLAHSSASSAEKTIFPQAAPGEAPNALPTGSASLRAFGSNPGWSNVSRLRGSIIATASFSVLIPSSTKSQAILIDAWAVLFPLRVWSIYNLPCSTVNSISCISL